MEKVHLLTPSLAGSRGEWLQSFEFYFLKRNSKIPVLVPSAVLTCSGLLRSSCMSTQLFLLAVSQQEHDESQQEHAALASSPQIPEDGAGWGRGSSPPFMVDSLCGTQASFWQDAEDPDDPSCPPHSRHRPGGLLGSPPHPARGGRAVRSTVRALMRGWFRARCPKRGASRPAGCRGGVSVARHRRPR